MRSSGRDPAHGDERALKRGNKNRQRQLAVAEWNATNERPPDRVFIEEILPEIRSISLNQLSHATGLSVDYCSKIRRGIAIPYPRHWKAFRALLVT